MSFSDLVCNFENCNILTNNLKLCDIIGFDLSSIHHNYYKIFKFTNNQPINNINS